MSLRYFCLIFCSVQIVVHGHTAEENSSNDDRLYHQAAFRDYFYVGGEYVTGSSGESLMKNQMYVERLSTGRKPTQPYPLVLIHGKAFSGANTWLNTPNGRPGWASYFLRHGYIVYIVDQPTRGRSAWLPGDFTMDTFSTELWSQYITAPERYNLFPQSVNHTQWPGNGTKGDQIFDAFFASTLQFLSNETEAQIKARDAVAALLDIIGTAILIAHSQGGLYSWLVADARPNLVKAIIALEPAGPPFEDGFLGGPALAWGLTDIAMTYNPPVSTPDQITKVRVPSNGTNVSDCLMQAEPARRLPNLEGIPVLIGVAEASFHAAFDQCTVHFLRQAGVNAELLRLESVGLHGNAHNMMLENNNIAVAGALQKWIRKIVAKSR